MFEVIDAVFGGDFASELQRAARAARHDSVIYGLTIPVGSLITHSERTNGPSEPIGGGAR